MTVRDPGKLQQRPETNLLRQAGCAGLLLLLAACAGTQSLPAANEALNPQITRDGTKFFVFTRDHLRVPEEEPIRPGQPLPQRQDLFSGEEYDVAIEQRLTLILEQTGYCREGYFERQRDVTRSGLQLRGECREAATDQDRDRFQAPINVTAIVDD